jgi:hypothetical protein
LGLSAQLAAAGELVGSRVWGGHAATEVFPFQTSIEMSEGYHCGGTLIAPTWILTAAHCTHIPASPQLLPASHFTVHIGGRTMAEGEVHSVKRVIRHEGYDAVAISNDIALMELDAPAQVAAIALEGMDDRKIAVEAQTNATIIGWGKTRPERALQDLPLQEAELPIIDNSTCNRSMASPETGPIDDRRICAGASEGGVDSCAGDSGGPLLVRGDGGWIQVGIVSYGAENVQDPDHLCGLPGFYGVYTRVAKFAPWIASRIGAIPPPPQSPPPLALGALAVAPSLIQAASSATSGVTIDILGGRKLRDGQSFRIRVATKTGGYLALFDIDDANVVNPLMPTRSTLVYHSGPLKPGATIIVPDATYGGALNAKLPPGQASARGRLLAILVDDRAVLDQVLTGQAQTPAGAKSMFARLELTLKPPAGPASADGSAPHWSAGLVDYIVEENAL